MFAKISSGATLGINACPVSIEVDISRGLPQIQIVGLPDASVSESRERVRSAIKASGFELPLGRIIVNMAPADLRKEGSHFDLPIAIGILASSGQIESANLGEFWFLGELSLNGQLKPTNGVLPIASSAKEYGICSLIVPAENAEEASLIRNLQVYAVSCLKEAVDLLTDQNKRASYLAPTKVFNPESVNNQLCKADFKYVKGQYQAKRALEIAAAGGHNILFIGQPGGGKSMLAQCLPSILPPVSEQMALEITKVYSVAGLLRAENKSFVQERPFRAPHHSISGAGLIGGGSSPKPGEVSLAHHGVLFLDELAEFDKKTLDNLRQPIESGEVIISRARFTAKYPARFLLIAACNPSTGINKVNKNKLIISAPLWDRFGLIVWVPALKASELMDFDPEKQESSAQIKQRVNLAWQNQTERFDGELNNACMGPADLKKYCTLQTEAEDLLKEAIINLSLTGRTYDHVLRVSRTIADLADCQTIEVEHIAEAIQYRTSQESLLLET